MSHRPIAIGLVLCEQVIVDQKTRNVTPVNCFSSRKLGEIPGRVSFCAVAWLTNGHGEVLLEVVVERLDSLEEIFREEIKANFADPLRETRCVTRLDRCTFSAAGYYQVSLLADRELLAQRRLHIHE